MYKHNTHTEEIEIYHNPNCSIAKSAVAYANSRAHQVVEYEYAKHKNTPTQWRQLLEHLAMSPRKLIDEESSYYQEHLDGMDLDDAGWIMVISRNPEIIRRPIAVRGEKAVWLENSADIRKL